MDIERACDNIMFCYNIWSLISTQQTAITTVESRKEKRKVMSDGMVGWARFFLWTDLCQFGLWVWMEFSIWTKTRHFLRNFHKFSCFFNFFKNFSPVNDTKLFSETALNFPQKNSFSSQLVHAFLFNILIPSYLGKESSLKMLKAYEMENNLSFYWNRSFPYCLLCAYLSIMITHESFSFSFYFIVIFLESFRSSFSA